MPGLRIAKEFGERGRDISNLRQIGTALLAYAGDHQNTFPAAGGRIRWNQTDSVTGSGPWTQQISPYLTGNTNVFFSRRALLPDSPGSPSPGYFLGTRPAMAADRRFGPVHLARLQAPSQTILGGLVAAPGLFLCFHSFPWAAKQLPVIMLTTGGALFLWIHLTTLLLIDRKFILSLFSKNLL